MNSTNTLIILLLFLSLISFPLMAIAALFWILSSQERWENASMRMMIYVILSFAISWLNTTKPVNYSDIGYYYWLFDFAGTKSLSEFYALIPKEPIYHLYTYVMNILTVGHFPTFITLTTMIMYLFVMAGYDLILRSQRDVDMRYAILAALMILLFVEYFFYTAQIVRQVLAGSVAFYGIARSIYGEGTHWKSLTLIVVAGFIHASAFVFCLFLVPYVLRNKSLTLQVLATGGILATYAVLLRFIGGLNLGSDTVSLAVNRGLVGDSTQMSVSLFPVLICLSALPMALWLMINAIRDRRMLEYGEQDEAVASGGADIEVDEDGSASLYVVQRNYVFFVSSCILPVFLILNYGNPLFVLRFMAYDYMLLPILIVLVLSRFRSGMLWCNIVVLVLFMRFVVKFSVGDFQYMNLVDYLFTGWGRAIM